jgi:sortase (surface protein transpeptidase)
VLALLGLASLAMAALSLAWPGRSREAPPPDSLYAEERLAQLEELVAPTATAPAVASLPVRLVIPKIGIDVPVTVKGLDPSGVMQNPNGPEDVAWYDFTARPGQDGNAVFSGHLDYHDYGPAVFARLREMTAGDLVKVRHRLPEEE